MSLSDGVPEVCTAPECQRPKGSRQYFQIPKGFQGGGRDWGEVVGEVLCCECFLRFSRNGKLKLNDKKVISSTTTTSSASKKEKEGSSNSKQQQGSKNASSAHAHAHAHVHSVDSSSNKKVEMKKAMNRCANGSCEHPTDSYQYVRIDEDCTAGGRDWSEHAGTTLCNACYCRFRDRGTLERKYKRKPKPASDVPKRCTYGKCVGDASRAAPGSATGRFYNITEGFTAGGRDWRELVGEVLCQPCFSSFKKYGRIIGTPSSKAKRPSMRRPSMLEDDDDDYLVNDAHVSVSVTPLSRRRASSRRRHDDDDDMDEDAEDDDHHDDQHQHDHAHLRQQGHDHDHDHDQDDEDGDDDDRDAYQGHDEHDRDKKAKRQRPSDSDAAKPGARNHDTLSAVREARAARVRGRERDHAASGGGGGDVGLGLGSGSGGVGMPGTGRQVVIDDIEIHEHDSPESA
jgi:hypothetical protein